MRGSIVCTSGSCGFSDLRSASPRCAAAFRPPCVDCRPLRSDAGGTRVMHATATARAAIALLSLLALLPTCGPAPQSAPAPVLNLAFAAHIEEPLAPPRESPLAPPAARAPPAPDQDFRMEELGRSELTSHHVGAIRTGEQLHRHDH